MKKEQLLEKLVNSKLISEERIKDENLFVDYRDEIQKCLDELYSEQVQGNALNEGFTFKALCQKIKAEHCIVLKLKDGYKLLIPLLVPVEGREELKEVSIFVPSDNTLDSIKEKLRWALRLLAQAIIDKQYKLKDGEVFALDSNRYHQIQSCGVEEQKKS